MPTINEYISDQILELIKTLDQDGLVSILKAKNFPELRKLVVGMLIKAEKLEKKYENTALIGDQDIVESIQLAAIQRLKTMIFNEELTNLCSQFKENTFLKNKAKSEIELTNQNQAVNVENSIPAASQSQTKPPPPTTTSLRNTLISKIEKSQTELADIAHQIEGISKEYGEKEVKDTSLNDIQAKVEKAITDAKAIQDELKKKGAVDDDDRKKHEALKSSIDKIKKDLAAAELNYIPMMHQAAEVNLRKAKEEHDQAVEDGKGLSSFSYFGLGSKEDPEIRRNLKESKQKLSKAKKELSRWDKALEAYKIEKDIIDRLKDSKISDEIKKCEAARQAIVVMERGLRERPADSMMSNIVMHRGGSLGFEAQVIEKSELPDYLEPLPDGTHSGARAVVELPNSTDESMYFMGTRLKSTEVVVYHKTVEQDDGSHAKVTLVQDQHSIRDHTPQKDWSKLSADENAKTALQSAIMYASNHKKGSSASVLRGQDPDQIQRIPAALLWVKHQVAHGFYDAVNDLGYGQLPQNSDLSDLVIHSAHEGPKKAGTFSTRSQKSLDFEFIKAHIPGLDTKSHEFSAQKHMLQTWKNESKVVKREDKSQSIQDPGQIHVIKPKGP